MQALDEALRLIDGTSIRYDQLLEHERRLLNLAIFDDFLIEDDGDGLAIEPQREETYVVLRQFADEIIGRSRPDSPPAGLVPADAAGNEANPSPLSLGQGSHKRKLAERGGFEPPVRVAPHTRFPSVLLQPLGHLSRL